jgi:hypothetical protein
MKIKKAKKKQSKDMTAAERANAAAGKGKGATPETVDKAEIIVSDKTPVDILPVLTDEQKEQKAIEDDKRFRELEISTRSNFVEMMFILREVQAYGLHKFMKSPKTGKGFTSFDTWLKDAAPLSRAGGYAALRAMEKLKAADKLIPIIPRKELEQMPRYSLDLLSKLPKVKLENPVIREAAKSQSKKDLVKTINEQAPDAHIEAKKTIQVDASSAPIILDAFKAAVAISGCAPEDALEIICADYLESFVQNNDKYAGLTVRQAYEAWKSMQPEAVKARVTEGENEDAQVENPDAEAVAHYPGEPAELTTEPVTEDVA